jgi:hypothetical protein
MNSTEILSADKLVKLSEYGQGSCFGCGGTVTRYKETGSGRVLDLCMACGEVVQSPRMVNGKLQDGFEPGKPPPDDGKEIMF